MGPKRYEPHTMHIWCNWHGGGGAPHFVVDLLKSPTGLDWVYVETLPGNGGNPSDRQPPGEPTPVYEGGPPGDQATVNYFIARTSVKRAGPGSLVIGLYKLRWTPPAGRAAGAPSPGNGTDSPSHGGSLSVVAGY